MAELVRTMAERLDRASPICTHAHNDYGLATANTSPPSTPALGDHLHRQRNRRAGRQRRSRGMRGRADHLYGVDHGVRAEKLPELASFVERASGIHMSAIKPVTGSTSTATSPASTWTALLKDTNSYEVLPPQWTGRERDYVSASTAAPR